ncbi:MULTISPECIES: bifunctional diguanylate cyclase/phosphodiesterase [Exiguobacterium]|uniref:bifunctional diguanylate cyclase/phosphodiesterase n=1 Tax=Exiguobacterium TaxID=33986 RepID=UPI001BE6E932|nr:MULTISPECIES: EAL domain-containing protein [Exiguobacterium]MCT4781678.1 EAL domain-containing protein [Exiguobacterium himgiriensis]
MDQHRFAKIPYRIYTMGLAVVCLIGVLLFGLGLSYYWKEKHSVVDQTVTNLNHADDLAGVESYLVLHQAARLYEVNSNQPTALFSEPYRERALQYNQQLQDDFKTGVNEREREALLAFSERLEETLDEGRFDAVPFDVIESIDRRWLYQGLERTAQENAAYELADAVMRMQMTFVQNISTLFAVTPNPGTLETEIAPLSNEARLIEDIVASEPSLQTQAVSDLIESALTLGRLAVTESTLEARYVNGTNFYEDTYEVLRSIRTSTETTLASERSRYGTLAVVAFALTVLLSASLLAALWITRNAYAHDLAHLKARALAIDPSMEPIEGTFPVSHDFRGIEDELREIAVSVHSTVHTLETKSNELLRYHERWSSLFSETGLAIALVDDGYNFLERNDVFRQFFGNRNLYEINQLFTDTGRRLFREAFEGVTEHGTSAQFILHLKGEHVRFLNMKIIPLKRGEALTYYLILEDETERVERERKVDRLVRFDMATDLYNEYGFVQAWAKQDINGAFVVIKLNDFHHLVDWYDATYADLLMTEFARHVEERLEKYAQNLFGRYRDDTLMLYVQGFTAEDEHELMELFPTELFINGKRQTVHVQIGATHTTPNFTDCLFEATKALQHAKETRTPFVWYDASILAQLQWAGLIEQALPDAISKGQITVAYQPQVELKTGRVVGAEALARWQHAELGQIPPNEFIRIAERSDQILWLSHSILDQVINQLVMWRDTPFSHISLSYNLSAHSVDPSIVTKLHEKIETYPWLPERLKIELTESADIMSHTGELDRLEDIADLGFCLSIDDFGTGYASFEAIWHLPIQEVKIDRMYVSGKAKDSTSFLRAVSRFASEQKLTSLAEGIETEEDLNRILAEGVELGQGYYYAPALQADAFEAWVQQKTGHSSE